ncbi:MAG: class I SAM-dependent methyltransferase [Actinomycetota bacterium]
MRGLSSQQHWDAVYRNRVPELVSWYQEYPALSLSFVAATGLGSDASVVDVGGGCSRLTDCLLDEGFTNLTVLDLSSVAIGYGCERLGDRADEVTWIEGDVLRQRFDATFDLWHDRAVLHFLVDPADQDRYVERLNAAVSIGGHVIIATFALDGPDKCSGLPVQRYGPEALSRTLGHEFEAVDFQHETHHTPTGATQQFLYGHFQRRNKHTS